jgi:arylsulfatase A-like enzyme
MTTSHAEYRDRAYRLYFQQVTCTVSLLDELLASISESEALENATIIIHGDHGSRITITDPVSIKREGMTERDYIDAFSTLFAIRAVGIEAGFTRERIAIQNLFAGLVLETTVPQEDAKVFLQTARANQRFGRAMERATMPAL